MNSNYKELAKLSAAVKRERAREYWRRWKERNAPRVLRKYGWTANFTHCADGWQWMATKQTNGATLENGYFRTPGLARADFYKAVEE